MKKSERLSVLIKIEKAKEREEALKLSEQQKIVKENKNKLSDLEAYLKEYREKYNDLAHHGAGADKIRHSYAFISQLNSAIAQQMNTIRDLEFATDKYRQNWLEAKQRTDILEKTVGKFRDEELRDEQKKEQLQADELARYKPRVD